MAKADKKSPEFAKRRLQPTDDFLSALVTANEAGDVKLTGEALIAVHTA